MGNYPARVQFSLRLRYHRSENFRVFVHPHGEMCREIGLQPVLAFLAVLSYVPVVCLCVCCEQPTAEMPGPRSDSSRLWRDEIIARKEQAKKLKEQRRYREALQAFERLAEAAPDDPEIRYHLATLIALMTSRHEEAVRQLQAALALRPDWVPALECLADIYGLLERHKEALKTVEKLISLKPREPRYLSQAAEICVRLTDREHSLDYVTQAANLEPENAEILARLGSVLNHWGETAQAQLYLEKAIGMDPTNARAYFELARIAFRRRDLERAEQYAARSIAANPFVQETHSLLARIYASTDRDTQARREIRIAEYINHMSELKLGFLKHLLQVGAVIAEEHFLLGEELARVGQSAWAVRELEAGLVLEPTAQAPLIPLALACLETGESEKAYRLIDRLSDPQLRRTGDALSALGWSAYRTGRFSVARGVVAAASAMGIESENLLALSHALQNLPSRSTRYPRWVVYVAALALVIGLVAAGRKAGRNRP